MKDKKGFTLIEMLLTSALLAVICLIVVPNVASTFKRAKDNEYQRFLNDIFLSTEAYIQKNIDDYPNLNSEGKKAYVYVEDLLKSKYLKSTLYDPKNKVKISEENYFTVEVIVKDDGSYTYKLYEELYKPYYCEYDVGKEWTFDYTGNEQEFTVPCNGTYKLEVWGAQGGSYNSSCQGGKGGYSTGLTTKSENQEMYIVVGGSGSGNGQHAYRAGGYNGGGNANSNSDGNTRQSSGGGATHIATTNRGILSAYSSYRSEILIVAGGGGGGGANSAIMCTSGGTGGGTSGGNGSLYNESSSIYGYGIGGTQTGPGGYYNRGVSGSFGTGGSFTHSGGGGGYYGGGAYYSGGGGSGYIGGVSNGTMENGYQSGNGYAKITYLGNEQE